MLSKEMYFKPLTLASVALFFREFSAINVVIFYTQVIFKDAGANFDPGAALRKSFCVLLSDFLGFNAFLVALAKTSGAGLSIMLVERCGRRILLVLSEVLICVSLVWL